MSTRKDSRSRNAAKKALLTLTVAATDETQTPTSLTNQPQRPKVVSVLAVLLVAGGLLALASLPSSYSQNIAGRIDREAFVLLHRDAGFHGWAVFNFWLGAVLAVPTIAVGVGLWRLRTWAFVSAIWLLWWQTISSIVGTTILNYAIWFGATPEVLLASQQAKFERFLAWVIGTLTGLVLLALCLFFVARLRRDAVRTQFV